MSTEFRDDLQSVHRRAYEWCLSNNLLREAINHMMAVGDWERASDTLESHLEEALSRNRLPTLENWILSLPQEIIDSRPLLLLGLGWVAILKRDVASAYTSLDKAGSHKPMPKIAWNCS